MFEPWMLAAIDDAGYNGIRDEHLDRVANEIYKTLQKQHIGAILDDRATVTMGAKIKDCRILGTPYLAVIGDKQEGDTIELENMKTGEKELLTLEQLVEKLR